MIVLRLCLRLILVALRLIFLRLVTLLIALAALLLTALILGLTLTVLTALILGLTLTVLRLLTVLTALILRLTLTVFLRLSFSCPLRLTAVSALMTTAPTVVFAAFLYVSLFLFVHNLLHLYGVEAVSLIFQITP